ncbi:MAG: EAL domain-containing protein, partial [Gammaproteobacteria bacterium]|nr:EAL domain-containing protein [Gammaproteobacteria bacterium]NIR96338.1 EAL domain-containing protein [Gammaproteobacteria bacterium]NIW45869.1 EAL domain-containing protein [Gammaproteobacteria bacterium]NIW97578.1 EAL domain-containing protein [Phycisphaerae bacterium]
ILAIEENQFELYFQPKISLHTMNMHGMEALLRWNHPDKGIIPPLEFMPTLEESGLINQV